MKTNKRRLVAVFLLPTLLLHLMIGINAALSEPAEQEERDPYDWSDYEGEVILDDPEFFLVDEESSDEIPETGEVGVESQLPQDDEQQEQGNGGQPADAPEDSPSDDPPQDAPSQTVDESTDDPPETADDGSPHPDGSGNETDAPADEPSNEPIQPADDPTPPIDEPGDDPDAPATDPSQTAEEPTDPPESHRDLKSLFLVEIKVPAGWFNLPEKAVRLKITPQTETLWDKILYRLDDGEWTEIKERFSFQDGYYYFDLTVNANVRMTVRLKDAEGDYFDTKKEIRIFDHKPPEVTAGIRDTMLHVVAEDDLSEVAGIQVNGLLFTTLEDGMLDVRMEEPLNAYKQLAIRAYDYAGNFSDPVTLDNPYYTEPTPTPAPTRKPAATKPPVTASPTPTPTPKATKKPSANTSTAQDTGKAKATQAPAATETTQTEKQEPIVIILTPSPTSVPAPTPTPAVEYVPLGPGQPFTQNGNMATRDVLYAANTNKQFISVQSRNGQTYFLVIDYDKPIDEENEIYETYFLNLVDDRDLMSVLTDEEIVPTPTPQIIYVTPVPTQAPSPTAAPSVETPPQQETGKMDSAVMTLLLLLILLAVAGLAFWLFRSQKDNKTPRIPEYDEDEGYEIEDAEEDHDSDE